MKLRNWYLNGRGWWVLDGWNEKYEQFLPLIYLDRKPDTWMIYVTHYTIRPSPSWVPMQQKDEEIAKALALLFL